MKCREKNKFGVLGVLLITRKFAVEIDPSFTYFSTVFPPCDRYLHFGNPCVFFFLFRDKTINRVRLVCRIETTSGDVISDLASEKGETTWRGSTGAVVVNASPTRRYYD